MDELKRRINERKFGSWEDLIGGGRRYSYKVEGRHGWAARYVKEVNNIEETLSFYQEIYDDNGKLVEIHEKYPDDNGHKKIIEDKT
ncbi:MAG: hypothetical protein C3F06_03180 [Candidatus Methanoperedenaceae archaeon]|nr:MAG: hypothetical protein C3F06_03180 [Candidatus Methanoperedenaceae archaeon]